MNNTTGSETSTAAHAGRGAPDIRDAAEFSSSRDLTRSHPAMTLCSS